MRKAVAVFLRCFGGFTRTCGRATTFEGEDRALANDPNDHLDRSSPAVGGGDEEWADRPL